MVGIGTITLAGWVIGVDELTRISPSLPEMKANTALALVALGSGILCVQQGPSLSRIRVGHGLGALVALFGAAIVFEYLVGDLGIDELLFADTGEHPGRPSPHTAVALIALGGSLATLDRGVPSHVVSGVLLLSGAAIVIAALVGYTYDVDYVRGEGGLTGISLITILALGTATFGVGAARPEHPGIAALAGDDAGAVLARRLTPAIILTPILLGLAYQQAQRDQLVDAEVNLALLEVVTIALLTFVTWLIARDLRRRDRQAHALRRELELAAAVTLNMAEGVAMIRASDSEIVYTNPTFDELFGYEAGELVGQPAGILHPRNLSPDEAGAEEGIDERMHRDGYATYEAHNIRKDGTEIWCRATSTTLSHPDHGEVWLVAQQSIAAEHRALEGRWEAEERFRRLYEDAPIGVALVSPDFSLIDANLAFAAITGYKREELREMTFAEITHPEDVDLDVGEARRLFAHEIPSYKVEKRYVRRDGSFVWIALTAAIVRSEDRSPLYAIAMVEDIDERRHQESELRQAEERFRRLFAATPIGTALCDLDGRIVLANTAMGRITGYGDEQLLGTDLSALTDFGDPRAGGEVADLLSGRIQVFEAERRCLRAGGDPIWVSLTATLLRDGAGSPEHILYQLKDISARKDFEGQLQYLADHDSLTGLFNRRRFELEMSREIATAARFDTGGAILMIDFDNFKRVNDTHGHAAGDELIADIARMLSGRLRETDILARLGGDEFGVILSHVDRAGALAAANGFCDAIRDRAELDQIAGLGVLTASIGVTTIDPDHAPEDLLVEADLAMYEAKEAGRNRAVMYNRTDDARGQMVVRSNWVGRIRAALNEDRFVLHAQPIVPLHTPNDHPRYELLLRMLDDDGELVPPASFLYLAERYDLVQAIDVWVIRATMDYLAHCRGAGLEPVLELNLSAKSIVDPTMLATIESEAAAAGVDPRGIVFEVTETEAIVNVAQAREFAEGLHGLGCEFALDDFGSGFASFDYLQRLTFDYLKIDGGFVEGLAKSRTNQLVVKSIAAIAKELDKKSIAEFVSDVGSVEILRDFGVDYGQGYHLGKPLPLEGLTPERLL